MNYSVIYVCGRVCEGAGVLQAYVFSHTLTPTQLKDVGYNKCNKLQDELFAVLHVLPDAIAVVITLHYVTENV